MNLNTLQTARSQQTERSHACVATALASVACAFSLALLCTSSSAAVTTYPLDDSLTQPGVASTQAQWLTPLPNRRATRQQNEPLQANARVRLVLDTRRFVGKNASVYMVRPRSAMPLEISWATAGLLRAGRMDAASTRVLIWSGVISQPRLTDTVDVSIQTSSQALRDTTSLEFKYEIDVEE